MSNTSTISVSRPVGLIFMRECMGKWAYNSINFGPSWKGNMLLKVFGMVIMDNAVGMGELQQFPYFLISLEYKFISPSTNKTRIGEFAQGQILCISPNGLQAGHCDTPPPPFVQKMAAGKYF